jgi:predicted nucleotidyltransferase
MKTPTEQSVKLLNKVKAQRDNIYTVLNKYGASNPRIFGSVARGNATDESDIDIVYDYKNPKSASLINSAGIFGEIQNILDMKVDSFAYSSLKPNIKKDIKSTKVIYV